ncbi:hypothetical protein BUALT_Bualt01G0237900 [Buddleja alternifolia]|uniref:DRBM domain-containing protein n=1 Tax=Buddleja alternifolia TaxID=168488 RepID=A0AAV6YK25_9LAMI|nr:hypothetical protein BUALT_Bualt01G0237900 [Buddleja alternifolia]
MLGVRMALGSEPAAERAVTKSDVGSPKDVVLALMETLVDPRLPFSGSVNDPPSKLAQKSIATQMHAVVLLYNYYHRKQNPELEFLNFVSFSKLAVSLRPSLTSFMKMMNESESMELSDGEDYLSLTEKAIKDACDISMALDAMKDNPTTEGCQISKVTVLLIDLKKENCLLQFGAITEGVWSLIEKEVNDSNINPDISAEEKVGNKRKRKVQEALIDDYVCLKLAFGALKDSIGIDSSDLVVLETHVAYSLSKKKSAAQFYMMQCSQSFSVNQSVPLKFLVESLEGPLAKKTSSGWTTTPVVEYHHMLPYVGFISRWLTGAPPLPVIKYNGNDLDCIDNNYVEKKVESSDTIVDESSEDNQKKRKYPSGCKLASSINKFNKRSDIQCSAKEAARGTHLVNLDNDGDKHEKASFSGNSSGLSQRTVKDDNVIEKFNKKSDFVDSAKNKVLSKGLCRKAATYEIVFEKFNKKSETADSVKKEEHKLDSKSHERAKASLAGSPKGMQRSNVNEFNKSSNAREDMSKKLNSKIRLYHQQSKNNSSDEHVDENSEVADSARKEDKKSDECSKGSLSGSSNGTQILNKNETSNEREDASKKLNSKIRVYHHRSKNISSDQEDGVNLKAEMADPLKSNDALIFRDEKVPENNVDVNISCNQNGMAGTDNQLVGFEANTNYNTEVQNVMASEELQNALALLYRKRQELGSQIGAMGDMLALCEDNIERIRDRGDVGLARKCVKSILSGNYQLLLKNEANVQDKGHQHGEDHGNSQAEKQTRLRDIFLPGKSSCQDLEYICLKNNWRLPRYLVEPSDGKFESNVVVESKDLKLSSKGDLESNPCDARESAAAQMILKMQSSFVIKAD